MSFTIWAVLMLLNVFGTIVGFFLVDTYHDWKEKAGYVLRIFCPLMLVITIVVGFGSCISEINRSSRESEVKCIQTAKYKKGDEVKIKTSDQILLVRTVTCDSAGIKYGLLTSEVNTVYIEQELLEKK